MCHITFFNSKNLQFKQYIYLYVLTILITNLSIYLINKTMPQTYFS